MKRQVIYRIIDTDGKNRRFNKRSIIFGIFAFISVAVFSFFFTANMHKVSATDFSQFRAGNIMSDAVMRNYTSMTEAEIQSFLKSKNSCNKGAIGWYVGDGWMYGVKYNYRYDYNGNTYYYHVENGHHICMADESFNGESAAHIIYTVAHQYKINPQVLIVLLEKEQGLISDAWPNVNYQYRSATGFGCPDTAPCDAEYYGLRNQIESAAWLFNQVLSGGWTNYPVGNNWIRFSPDGACGGSNVYIENLATSALYRYTPYQPNQGALNAYPGGAYCGAYGNRNFYAFFTDWFGSTQKVQYTFPQNYYRQRSWETGLLVGETKCVDGNGNTSNLSQNGDYYCNQDFEKGTLFWNTNVKNGVKTESDEVFYNQQKANIYKNMSIEQRKDGIYRAWMDDSESAGKTTSGVYLFDMDNNYRVLQTEKGVVLGNDAVGYSFYKQKAFNVYRELYTSFGKPVAGHAENIWTKFEWYTFEKGLLVGNDTKGWFILAGGIQGIWASQGFESGSLGFPKSNILVDNALGITYQEYDGGIVASVDGGATYFSIKAKPFNVYRELYTSFGKPVAGHAENIWTKFEWYTFEKGLLVGNDTKGWFILAGGIQGIWASQGFESGSLGFPKSNILVDNALGITYQEYDGGIVASMNNKDYFFMKRKALDAWKVKKDSLGQLVHGYEKNIYTGMEWVTFENGMIMGNDVKGWYESRGGIQSVWIKQGFESGPLGFPKSDITEQNGIYSQVYEGGVISGNDQIGYSIKK